MSAIVEITDELAADLRRLVDLALRAGYFPMPAGYMIEEHPAGGRRWVEHDARVHSWQRTFTGRIASCMRASLIPAVWITDGEHPACLDFLWRTIEDQRRWRDPSRQRLGPIEREDLLQEFWAAMLTIEDRIHEREM